MIDVAAGGRGGRGGSGGKRFFVGKQLERMMMMMATEEAVRKKKRPSSSSACWWNFRVPFSLTFATYIAITGFLQLRKPLMNRCTMTYMYPSYIPVPPAVPEKNSTSNNNRHALYLYHEGWKKIDHQLHLAKLSGVPVLFIPGNGGSYKQVWCLNPKSHLSSSFRGNRDFC
jgi:hypothetical protein